MISQEFRIYFNTRMSSSSVVLATLKHFHLWYWYELRVFGPKNHSVEPVGKCVPDTKFLEGTSFTVRLVRVHASHWSLVKVLNVTCLPSSFFIHFMYSFTLKRNWIKGMFLSTMYDKHQINYFWFVWTVMRNERRWKEREILHWRLILSLSVLTDLERSRHGDGDRGSSADSSTLYDHSG